MSIDPPRIEMLTSDRFEQLTDVVARLSKHSDAPATALRHPFVSCLKPEAVGLD